MCVCNVCLCDVCAMVSWQLTTNYPAGCRWCSVGAVTTGSTRAVRTCLTRTTRSCQTCRTAWSSSVGCAPLPQASQPSPCLDGGLPSTSSRLRPLTKLVCQLEWWVGLHTALPWRKAEGIVEGNLKNPTLLYGRKFLWDFYFVNRILVGV